MALQPGRRRPNRWRYQGTGTARVGGMNTVRYQRKRCQKPILITGGSGFIGCNIADALLTRGDRVLLYDNLRRPGAEEHAHWLKDRHGDGIEIEVADVRDPERVEAAVAIASAVLHPAAHVA